MQLLEQQKDITYELLKNYEKVKKDTKINDLFDKLENRFENSEKFFKLLNILLAKKSNEKDTILELSSHIDRLSDLMKRDMIDKKKI